MSTPEYSNSGERCSSWYVQYSGRYSEKECAANQSALKGPRLRYARLQHTRRHTPSDYLVSGCSVLGTSSAGLCSRCSHWKWYLWL